MSAKMDLLVKKLTDAMLAVSKKKSSAYDSTATVRRIDGDTVWVHLPGGVDETPIQKTIACSPGDTVQVRVSEGRAWIQGNHSAPPTDDTTAIHARRVANKATTTAETAEETATEAQTTAVDAKETAEAILIYDHTYSLRTDSETGHLIADFMAYLYQGGVDIKTKYDPELFTWYLKTEDGTEYIGNGYTCTVDTTACGYGAEVIGKFTETEDAEVLDSVGNTLTDNDGNAITVRATGDQVKVRELTTSTIIYQNEKLMVVGNEDEHLVTVETLYGYLLSRLAGEVIYCGTSTELVG